MTQRGLPRCRPAAEGACAADRAAASARAMRCHTVPRKNTRYASFITTYLCFTGFHFSTKQYLSNDYPRIACAMFTIFVCGATATGLRECAATKKVPALHRKIKRVCSYATLRQYVWKFSTMRIELVNLFYKYEKIGHLRFSRRYRSIDRSTSKFTFVLNVVHHWTRTFRKAAKILPIHKYISRRNRSLRWQH